MEKKKRVIRSSTLEESGQMEIGEEKKEACVQLLSGK